MSIEEKLINEVQQYPIIYDISNKYYYLLRHYQKRTHGLRFLKT